MSLRSRIVLAVTAVFAVVSLLSGWMMLNRAERSLQTAFDRATRTRAEWLLSLVSIDPVVLPLPTDQERMRVIYRTYGHHRELFHSPGFPGSPGRSRHKFPRYDSYRAVTTQTSTDQLSEGQILLTLVVPDYSLRQDISQLRWLFGLGWLVSLALAFVAGYGAAGWLLRPIQAIISQANTISKAGDSSQLTLPKTRDEIYQLTDTLNRMLARIRENVDLQQNFFGAAAHELRTPLTVMKTGLEVSLDSEQVDSSMKSFLVGQLDEVSRLARLLDEFLTLSRPDEAAQPLNIAEASIPIVVKYCTERLANVAVDYEVTTHLDIQEQAGETILTDAVKLEHIVLNLLENAIKYAVPNSAVLIQVRYTGTWQIRFQNQTVRECGPTLDLMQPFFQADPFKEGHGLGLWISHRLTTMLNGTLHLEWQAFTFTSELTLPSPITT
ncbi:HAMP domain-containing protein [Spirosoma sp. HMF4905]|uniref:histidine kinase n=1 Tax=Spirosoma arboris TaxID=2682092 RepID=A0A7K1SPU6_9BACT|nr:HAMP domain-containing sensor histidine kinase [Spirosoma arboris]MVM35819.1 HAMP domain-containing protein [Spirosoma arboris]